MVASAYGVLEPRYLPPRKSIAMKVTGPLTHARFIAEAARINRKVSRWIAHESLRIHSGQYDANDLVSKEDVDEFHREINETLKDIKIDS